ncbi:hypothetical protein BDV59DRAFT_150669 [Aspergillus ambiguus]|uniref:uncharacterized protein n=1 Tax=Aspergillus ambiguus TaxID=176160 RepID=UPI003CCD9C6E
MPVTLAPAIIVLLCGCTKLFSFSFVAALIPSVERAQCRFETTLRGLLPLFKPSLCQGSPSAILNQQTNAEIEEPWLHSRSNFSIDMQISSPRILVQDRGSPDA